jgi:DnaJ-class molecular chaperone
MIIFCSDCRGTGLELDLYSEVPVSPTCHACKGTGHWNQETEETAPGPCGYPACAGCMGLSKRPPKPKLGGDKS